MRRLKRAILRHRGEKLGVKPSRYVSRMWDRLQTRRVGPHVRALNRRHGTKTKKQWHAA